MDSITYTYDQMRSVANEVDSLADEYSTKYQNFLKEVDTLTTTDFIGEDADAFKEKAEAFRPDFNKMKELMNEYATFIRRAAEQYKETEMNLKQQAQSLGKHA